MDGWKEEVTDFTNELSARAQRTWQADRGGSKKRRFGGVGLVSPSRGLGKK
jgi:hypothetical protein